MSFDLFISGFLNGEPAYFPRSIVENAFQSYVVGIEHDERTDAGTRNIKYEVWSFDFEGQRSHSVIYIDEGEYVDGFSVERPSGAPSLWNALLEVLKQTPTVLYWPGTKCVTCDPRVVTGMPKGFLVEGGPGRPILVSTVEEIQEAIETS